jgi:hypothetical protein
MELGMLDEMDKWTRRIDMFLNMFNYMVVGMSIMQFIILFVSSNMTNPLELNGRVCMLWA